MARVSTILHVLWIVLLMAISDIAATPPGAAVLSESSNGGNAHEGGNDPSPPSREDSNGQDEKKGPPSFPGNSNEEDGDDDHDDGKGNQPGKGNDNKGDDHANGNGNNKGNDNNDAKGNQPGKDKGSKGDDDHGNGNGNNKGNDDDNDDDDEGKDHDDGNKGDDSGDKGNDDGDDKGNQPGKDKGNKGDGHGNDNGNDNQPGKGNGQEKQPPQNRSPPVYVPPPSADISPPGQKNSPPQSGVAPAPDSSDASGKNRYAPPPKQVTPPGPPSSWPPTPSGSSASPKKVKCKNMNYPHCYATEHVCPSSCPGGCKVDCVSCKPVCSCDIPGAVCQDPRFIGGDGITFYFHGKKDKDFCIVSDSNLHINAHFIGRRNQDLKRDFTWVQSIGILFDNHKLYIGAEKTATWNEAIDRLSLTFDDEPILLPDTEGARWQSDSASVTRISDTNNIVVEVEGIFRITAKVVSITKKESRVHNYGITEDDCFAHLELAFKFFSLSDGVNGILGQTYGNNYVTRVKMGVLMPVMGGEREFASSNIFATDCSVAKFQGRKFSPGLQQVSSLSSELPGLKCYSRIDGRGVVCKR